MFQLWMSTACESWSKDIKMRAVIMQTARSRTHIHSEEQHWLRVEVKRKCTIIFNWIIIQPNLYARYIFWWMVCFFWCIMAVTIVFFKYSKFLNSLREILHSHKNSWIHLPMFSVFLLPLTHTVAGIKDSI